MTSKFCGRLAVMASFVAALVMPLTSSAQEGENQGPVWLQVRSVSLNADGAASWQDLQKQLAEANRAAEAPRRDVWEEVRGDLDTYHIVSFPENMAEFDEQGENLLGDAQGDWVASIVPTVSDRTQTILRQHQNLAIPVAEDYEPNLLVVSNTRIQSTLTSAMPRIGFADIVGRVLINTSRLDPGADKSVPLSASGDWALWT